MATTIPIVGCARKSADGVAKPSIVERVKAAVVEDEPGGTWHDKTPNTGPYGTIAFDHGRMHGTFKSWLVPVALNFRGTYVIRNHPTAKTFGHVRLVVESGDAALTQMQRLPWTETKETSFDHGALLLTSPPTATQFIVVQRRGQALVH